MKLSSDILQALKYTNYDIIIVKLIVLSITFARPSTILPVVREITCTGI
jgi:hypothetical protein